MNADPAISALIREVLAEELSRIKPVASSGNGAVAPPPREETVSIANDAELQAFVRRLLDLSEDNAKRQEIRQGRLVFRLADNHATHAAPAPAHHASEAQSASPTVSIDQGFFSERQVDQLPNDTKRIKLSKRVKMTPLARDRLRQRGIAIERTE